MSSTVNVAIHPSQFPENIRRDLLQSLRARQVNHKFHYDNVKQTQQWLALHQAYSPSRTDADCAAIYDAGFASVAQQIGSTRVHLIGLGCGGGQKDTRLLRWLHGPGRTATYTPVDVGVPMVLVARQAALVVLNEDECHPLVCDLLTADDLPAVAAVQTERGTIRLITFFGMIPNFEPQAILPKLAALLRPDDHLLFSANLAPGADYAAGVRRILPLYGNALTRDWLMTFLLDLGVEAGDGTLRFGVEDCPAGTDLQRVAAHFHFDRPRQVVIEDERFSFQPGEAIRLFFSYRHTPDRIRALLDQHGVSVRDQWITPSEEEGVFFCRRK